LGAKVVEDAELIRLAVEAVGGFSTFVTSCPDIHTIGDVHSGSVNRGASSVGEGSVVVSAVHGYLATQESKRG
jgi:thioredoxin reductase (NADPH)